MHAVKTRLVLDDMFGSFHPVLLYLTLKHQHTRQLCGLIRRESQPLAALGRAASSPQTTVGPCAPQRRRRRPGFCNSKRRNIHAIVAVAPKGGILESKQTTVLCTSLPSTSLQLKVLSIIIAISASSFPYPTCKFCPCYVTTRHPAVQMEIMLLRIS